MERKAFIVREVVRLPPTPLTPDPISQMHEFPCQWGNSSSSEANQGEARASDFSAWEPEKPEHRAASCSSQASTCTSMNLAQPPRFSLPAGAHGALASVRSWLPQICGLQPPPPRVGATFLADCLVVCFQNLWQLWGASYLVGGRCWIQGYTGLCSPLSGVLNRVPQVQVRRFGNLVPGNLMNFILCISVSFTAPSREETRPCQFGSREPGQCLLTFQASASSSVKRG